jgi:UDP-N-acetyl-2-amino-2-deoxyglucuronate dehydrogenase
VEVFEHSATIARGRLVLEKATVNWVLSVDYDNIPDAVKATGARTFREIKIGDEAFEFSGGFTELHTRSYQDVLDGGGFRVAVARPAIELVHAIRNAEVG